MPQKAKQKRIYTEAIDHETFMGYYDDNFQDFYSLLWLYTLVQDLFNLLNLS